VVPVLMGPSSLPRRYRQTHRFNRFRSLGDSTPDFSPVTVINGNPAIQSILDQQSYLKPETAMLTCISKYQATVGGTAIGCGVEG